MHSPPFKGGDEEGSSGGGPEGQGKKFVELMRTSNPAELAFIKSVLNSEGINYRVFDEHFPYVGAALVPARVMVEKKDESKAKALLEPGSGGT